MTETVNCRGKMVVLGNLMAAIKKIPNFRGSQSKQLPLKWGHKDSLRVVSQPWQLEDA